MSNVFEDVQRGHILGGTVYNKKTKTLSKAIPTRVQKPSYTSTPYYEGGMHLETYGESKLRGFRRAVARKAPVIGREIISTAKRTITPAMKQAGTAVLKVGLKIGKAQFEDLRKRKAKGINVWW